MPNEKEFLVGALHGKKNKDSWNVAKEELDFFDVKGIIEELFFKLGLNLEFLKPN